MFRVDMLPGREGDCLWIEYGDTAQRHRILIDGGRKAAYSTLKRRIAELPVGKRTFELIVLSHVDADHIEGLLKLLADAELGVCCEDIWFNGKQHLEEPSEQEREDFGAVQGEALTEAILHRRWKWNAAYNGKSVVIPDSGCLPVKVLPGGMRLTLLSPTWEKLRKLKPVWEKEVAKAGLTKKRCRKDRDLPGMEGFGPLTIAEVEMAALSAFQADGSAANGSSICLLAEFDGRKAVFAGDGHADVLAFSLKKLSRDGGPLNIDAFKISHHGSRGTHSVDLMKRIRCKRFLISTDGSRHRHPHEEAIARILKFGGGELELRFNYETEHTGRWDDQQLKKHFGYVPIYPQAHERGVLRTDL